MSITLDGSTGITYPDASVQRTAFIGSWRNKIINGNFDHWQRGTSNTSIDNGQYLADRWTNFRSGTTANISRQAFTLGQTDVPGEPTYFQRTVTTSSAGAGNYFILYQPIESVRTLAGQTATLSFWTKADASKNIAVEVVQGFGTGGSPSSSVIGIGVTTCALTTSWQKFTVTVNIPSISGKTLGSNNNDYLGLNFWFDAGSAYNSRTNSLGQQSGTFDIAQVQLEAGPVATPFEVRPMGTELALCQRYYQSLVSPPARGVVTSSSSVGRIGFVLPVTMRAAPTLSMSGTLLWFDGSGIGTITLSTISAGYSTTDSWEIDANFATGTSALYRPVIAYIGNPWNAIASAEL